MASVPSFVFRYCALFSFASGLALGLPIAGGSAARAESAIAPTQPEVLSPLAQAVDDDLRPLAQNDSLLSVEGGRRLMEEANAAVSAQDYSLAQDKLKSARQVFNQVSNFYSDLAGAFTGIDSRISSEQRNKAVEAAQMRDEATYQLALVHRAKNEPDLAVPLLVQIIRSQNPTQDLGQRAYRQLFEMGFVDTEYPRS